MQASSSNIRWFSELGIEDVSLVGRKNASLGEMYRGLTVQGIRVANGFATTAEAYRATLAHGNAWYRLQELMEGSRPETNCRAGMTVEWGC